MPKLYEITAMVSYAIVLRADSKEQALEYVSTWEHAWEANADLREAHAVDLVDIRDGIAEEAHMDITREAVKALMAKGD